MKIVFLTPHIQADRFAGGIYCILKYAQGLHQRGHEVSIVAYPKSERPQWTSFDGRFITPSLPSLRFGSRREFKISLSERLEFQTLHRRQPTMRRALLSHFVGNAIPEADITIATYWETAPIAMHYGRGAKAYFMQHLESLFYEQGSIEQSLALSSYTLPIHRIANSTWLYNQIEHIASSLGLKRSNHQCTNAVDLEFYRRNSQVSKLSTSDREINIISYGGRNVAWKGFREMAEAVASARRTLPDYRINWNVYGESALPADNDTAPFNSLGFLNPTELAAAYNANDILLSASWYESFPLFPIEAMACGLPVITTAPGTEDYAIDGENAVVVKARDVDSIADGLVRLITDKPLRESLSANAEATAQRFSWNRSVDTMEALLRRIIEEPGH